MLKKKTLLIKALSRLSVLITVSENVECKICQSYTLIHETILTYSVRLVFNISNKLQTKDKIVDNLLTNLIKAFSSETQHAALLTFSLVFNQLCIHDIESIKENNVFNMSVDCDVRKSQKSASIFNKIKIKMSSLKEIASTQHKYKASQQLVLSLNLELVTLRLFKKSL